MKKLISVLLCAAVALALCSCSLLYDENDTEFTGGAAKDPVTPQIEPDNPETPSVLSDPGVVGTSYVADGFSFVIPVAWRGNISVTINETTVNGVYVVERQFYFLDSNAVPALIMMIYEVSTEAIELLGIDNATAVCRSSDGSLSFLNIPFTITYPDGFSSINDFVAVYEVLGSSNFTIEPTV